MVPLGRPLRRPRWVGQQHPGRPVYNGYGLPGRRKAQVMRQIANPRYAAARRFVLGSGKASKGVLAKILECMPLLRDLQMPDSNSDMLAANAEVFTTHAPALKLQQLIFPFGTCTKRIAQQALPALSATLQSLSVTWWFRAGNDVPVLETLASGALPKLTHLHLEQRTYDRSYKASLCELTDAKLQAIIEGCPRLTHLALPSHAAALTAASVAPLRQHRCMRVLVVSADWGSKSGGALLAALLAVAQLQQLVVNRASDKIALRNGEADLPRNDCGDTPPNHQARVRALVLASSSSCAGGGRGQARWKELDVEKTEKWRKMTLVRAGRRRDRWRGGFTSHS